MLESAKQFEPTGRRAGIVPMLLSADLKITADFYSGLGFAVTRSKPFRRLEIERGGSSIHFFDDPAGTQKPSLTGTIYVFVENVDALAREWESKVELLWGPELLPSGLYEFGISDPDEYYLAFAEIRPVESTKGAPLLKACAIRRAAE